MFRLTYFLLPPPPTFASSMRCIFAAAGETLQRQLVLHVLVQEMCFGPVGRGADRLEMPCGIVFGRCATSAEHG